MNKSKSRRSYGIWVRGYVPMFMLIIALCITIYVYIVSSGMPEQLNKNADQTMETIVQARTDYIVDSMAKRWSEMTAAVQSITSIYEENITKKGYTAKDLISQEDLYVDFLSTALNPSIELLRRNAVSGVYIVLADEESVLKGKTSRLPGTFLRDRDPTSAYNNTNKDLLFERGPVVVVKSSGISTDSFWSPSFSVSYDGDLGEVFFKPYFAALENPSVNSSNLAYWTTNATLEDHSTDSFFYSMPLISNEGEIFGVIGIDITKNYFAQFISYEELFNGEGAYAIYKTNEDGNIEFLKSFSKTGKYLDDFWNGLNIEDNSKLKSTLYEYDKEYNVQISQFKLYNNNSPFAKEKWYICAAIPSEILYETTNQTMVSVLMLVVWLALIAVIGVGTILYQIVRPIKRLEKQLKSRKIDCEELNLDATGISELDMLANAVEKLNMDVRTSAGKFSQMLEMSSINLGAFEFDKNTEHWFISNNFFRVFDEKEDFESSNLESSNLESSNLESSNLESTLKKLNYYKENALEGTIIIEGKSYECVCEIVTEDNRSNFARIIVDECDDFVRGFVEDVTIEWREIRKLAYERNHDNLTEIYNRRGFYEKFNTYMKLSNEELKTAIVIMLDLDNLKIVNDTHGHDVGDKYIKATADVLKRFSSSTVIVSRISGDEFLVFAYGFNNKAECSRFIDLLEKNFSQENISIGNNDYYPLCVSAGVAHYPIDSIEENELVKFADFAMYQGKRYSKGKFVRFDKSIYEKEEYRIKCKEALNEVIKNNLIEMHFQPIVNAKTGKVFSYEALMRPQNEILKSPLDLLKTAKDENRLIDIESMTTLAALKSFAFWCENGAIEDPACKLFINTIVNVIIPKENVKSIESKYAEYLPRIVCEYTEDEKADEDILAYKRNIVTRWGGEVALDDYGSGYNGEAMLLNTDIQYIKLDISMIKNIHSDPNRQQRVTDIINYAHSRNIMIIAEGVEIEEECKALIKLGADLLQGYYFAKPSFVPLTPDANLCRVHSK